jgi:hypothetical protein
MAPLQPAEGGESATDLEFFGVKLKVKNPRLAALLNSDVNDDVQLIGRRARDAFAGADDAEAEREIEHRLLRADDSVRVRLDEVEDG